MYKNLSPTNCTSATYFRWNHSLQQIRVPRDKTTAFNKYEHLETKPPSPDFSILHFMQFVCRSHWPRGLRHRSAAARLLRSWVGIPPGTWMFVVIVVCCDCCFLWGRGLCDEVITRPEEYYRLWCVVMCDLETSRMRRPWSALGRSVIEKKNQWRLLMFCVHWAVYAV